ncbi:glycine receptor subunit alpha-4-like isoform X2 [Amphiura filiformis]
MDRLFRNWILTVLLLCLLSQSTHSTTNSNCTEKDTKQNGESASVPGDYGYGNDYSSQDPGGMLMFDPDVGVDQITTTILFKMLETYDDRIRPSTEGAPTKVRVNLVVISMDSVTEVSMDYSMTILLHQFWNDPRLAYDNLTNIDIPFITSGYNFISKIWVPDLFFANEKRASFHDITVQNRLIRLLPNGDMFYSMKLSLVLFCRMDFKAFPMDKQNCKTTIESYQNTENELVLTWNDPKYVEFQEISLPQYTMLVDHVKYGNCVDRVSHIGNYSCIFFHFWLERELTFYVLQTYIPTSLLVFISWVSFWIEIGQAPARCSLGVTTILTMTTTTVGYGSSAGLPKVSYTKAIDIWFDACLTFVIGSLVEYAVVHYLWTKDRAEKHLRWALRKESTRLGQNGNRSPNGSVPADIGKQADPFADPEKSNTRYSYQTTYRPVRSSMHFSEDPEVGFPVSKLETGNIERDSFHEKRRAKLLALRIDRAARFFFPICYGAFIVVYWTYYLAKMNEDHVDV